LEPAGVYETNLEFATDRLFRIPLDDS